MCHDQIYNVATLLSPHDVVWLQGLVIEVHPEGSRHIATVRLKHSLAYIALQDIVCAPTNVLKKNRTIKFCSNISHIDTDLNILQFRMWLCRGYGYASFCDVIKIFKKPNK